MDQTMITRLIPPRPLWQWPCLIGVYCLLWAIWEWWLVMAWIGNEVLWRLPFIGFSLCAYVSFTFLLKIRREYQRRVAWEEAQDEDADYAFPTPREYDEPTEASVDVPFAPQLDLQEEIRLFLLEQPEYERRLNEIVAWERSHPPQSAFDGWSWFDTHTPARMCTQLVGRGFVSVCYDSRSSTQYRLVSLEDTEEAMANLRILPSAAAPLDTSALFRFVVRHERAKGVLIAAIEAEKPVHVLLTGPPGTAKTLLLADVGSLPGAEFYAGSTTTKAGLVSLLLSKRPKYLVVDEIDKMAPEDMTPLLNLMEGGVVTRLQARQQIRETMDTRVFAGGNEVEKLARPILSRFARVEIPPYTAAEFVQVAQAVLVQREGIGPNVALAIATAVVVHSTDIRDAVRVARLSRGKAMQVDPVVASLFPAPLGQRPLPYAPR